MDNFFGKDFNGPAFQLFSLQHLAAIAVLLLLIGFFFWLRRHPSERAEKITRWTMAVVLVVNESLWHLWNYVNGTWTVQTMLPLHLCSVFVFLSAIMLVTRSYGIFEFAFFLGIGGAMQAFLTPDLGIYSFPHFRYFQVFVSHGLIIASACYMLIVEHMRPTWKSLLKVIVVGNLYFVALFFINRALGSNYMYILHKPQTASLMDFLGPWPWYLLSLEGVAGAAFLLFYSPYAISDSIRNRKSKAV
jgi:hypothetical integral membrane protein (TIGR02206 family)